MRYAWPIVAGVLLAFLVTVVVLPVFLAAAGATALAHRLGARDSGLAGISAFAVKDDHGRLAARLINHTYQTVSAVLPGDPRPRRLLLRQQVSAPDVFSQKAEGKVRLDAWLFEGASDLMKAPLYTILAQGSSGQVGEDGLYWVDRGGRRSAYAVGTGAWLFDTDTPVAIIAAEGEPKRFVAVAAAEEDLPAKSVAVITLAAPGRMLRRAMVVTDDALRARTLRATMAAARPVTRTDETGRRVLELPLPSGVLRVGLKAEDFDMAVLSIPPGLGLVPMTSWGVVNAAAAPSAPGN